MKRISNESINEELYHARHKSGLDIYILPKKGYSQYFGVIAYHFGSNDTEFLLPDSEKSTKVPEGIAHFLEHKMFEQEKGSIFDEYGALGSSPNAYTNVSSTAYVFSASRDVKRNIELLFKCVQNPYFSEESIEKEREVIAQEIKMYDDNPNWQVYYNMLDCLFTRHPVKRNIAGSVDTISKIDKNLLYLCYNEFYKFSNAVFFMSGDVNPHEVYEWINSYIDESKISTGELPKRVYPHESPEINRKESEQRMSISMPLFAAGFKDMDVGFGGSELLKKELVTAVALDCIFGRSSDLFMRLYDEGLVNDTFGSDYVGEKDYGYSMIGGESKDPDKLFDTVRSELAKGSEKLVDEKKFQTARKKFIGQFLSSFNSIEYIGSNFVSYYMRSINLLDYIDALRNIEYEEVLERVKSHLIGHNMAVSVIRPL